MGRDGEMNTYLITYEYTGLTEPVTEQMSVCAENDLAEYFGGDPPGSAMTNLDNIVPARNNDEKE